VYLEGPPVVRSPFLELLHHIPFTGGGRQRAEEIEAGDDLAADDRVLLQPGLFELRKQPPDVLVVLEQGVSVQVLDAGAGLAAARRGPVFVSGWPAAFVPGPRFNGPPRAPARKA
jgi:hypothetical protein